MLNRDAWEQKRSKTEAVQTSSMSARRREHSLGPSDYVPFLKDNKICFLRVEGTGFGGVPIEMELRLSVEDSPNSAGVVVDAVRCCKWRETGMAGPIDPVCAWTMKRPADADDGCGGGIALDEFIERTAAKSPMKSSVLNDPALRLRKPGGVLVCEAAMGKKKFEGDFTSSVFRRSSEG